MTINFEYKHTNNQAPIWVSYSIYVVNSSFMVIVIGFYVNYDTKLVAWRLESIGLHCNQLHSKIQQCHIPIHLGLTIVCIFSTSQYNSSP